MFCSMCDERPSDNFFQGQNIRRTDGDGTRLGVSERLPMALPQWHPIALFDRA